MNELIVLENKKTKIKNMVINFFIYAFLGWILETIYAFLVHGHFVNRGFLIGPICPIYGFGAVILLLLLNNSKGKYFYEFFIAAIAFTIFEYMVSYVLEAIFGLRWWDYSNDFLNLQGRVSLAYSIIWGVMGILLTELINPFISKLINKVKKYINNKVENVVLLIFIITLIIDFAISSIKFLTM